MKLKRFLKTLVIAVTLLLEGSLALFLSWPLCLTGDTATQAVFLFLFLAPLGFCGGKFLHSFKINSLIWLLPLLFPLFLQFLLLLYGVFEEKNGMIEETYAPLIALLSLTLGAVVGLRCFRK